MMRTILKVALVLVGGHLLFGFTLLVIDKVHGINDQDFSFALSLLYYYLNYSAVWLIRCIKAETSISLLILMAMPQWIFLSFIIGTVINLFCKKKAPLT